MNAPLESLRIGADRGLRRRHVLALAAAGISIAPPAMAQTAAEPLPSVAERLVFIQPHLANIEPPRILQYRYRREGGGPSSLEGDVTIALRRSGAAGCCAVHGSYLSGENAVVLPDIEQANANPVVLFFLEHQVRQLQRRSGGSIAHFRRRIRLALADAATVDSTTVRWGGRDIAARVVRIAPFVDDPYRSRFEADADLQYSFVLSDDVPGGIYQLRAALPGADAARQTLTLAEPAERPTDKR